MSSNSPARWHRMSPGVVKPAKRNRTNGPLPRTNSCFRPTKPCRDVGPIRITKCSRDRSRPFHRTVFPPYNAMPSAEHVRTARETSQHCESQHRETGQIQPEHSLNELLDHLTRSARDGTAERRKVSLGHVLDAIGRHSFAPLLMVAGLIMFAPGPADIPGVPVVIGLFVI